MNDKSNSKQPVLILGVEPRITIPIARSLHRYGVPVEAASLSSTEPQPGSRAIRNFTRLPEFSASSPEFIGALETLIAERHYDTLIPATDAALGAISHYDERLRRIVELACPAPEIVQRVLNKSLTLEIAKRAGIRIPGSFRATNLAELEALRDKLQFPVVAKPYHKSSETDFKVRYFKSFEDLHRAMESDDQLGSRILLQEYCPGDGVGVEMLIRNGEPIATFQHRRLKEVPHTGGAAVLAVAETPDPELVQQALTLLRAIEWEGVAMVEFRFHRPDRRLALMEVNGRYWGTLSLPIQAGIDFPLYHWQVMHGETPVVPSQYAVGMIWRWSAGYVRRWHGVLAGSAKKALRNPGVLKDLLPSWSDVSPFTRDSLWKVSDPAPAALETLRSAFGLIGSDLSAIFRRVRKHGSGAPRQQAAVAMRVKQDAKEH